MLSVGVFSPQVAGVPSLGQEHSVLPNARGSAKTQDIACVRCSPRHLTGRQSARLWSALAGAGLFLHS